MFNCIKEKLKRRKQKKEEIFLHISDDGATIIKLFEGGFRSNAYTDSGGVWTIGYGTTRISRFKKVKRGMFITKKQGEEYFTNDISKFEKGIHKLVDVYLHQHEFDALVSWTYNLGVNALKTSTLLKVLNAGWYEQVPKEMRKWIYDNKKKVNGLIKRRKLESGLFEGTLSYVDCIYFLINGKFKE